MLFCHLYVFFDCSQCLFHRLLLEVTVLLQPCSQRGNVALFVYDPEGVGKVCYAQPAGIGTNIYGCNLH